MISSEYITDHEISVVGNHFNKLHPFNWESDFAQYYASDSNSRFRTSLFLPLIYQLVN